LVGDRNSETAALRSENRRSASRSPEKEERCYPTRGSAEENGKVAADGGGGNLAGNHAGDDGNRGGVVWPKLYITLSSKEKEEDFMAMKGCKLPQRPKKRAKVIQRTLLVSIFSSSSYFPFVFFLINFVKICDGVGGSLTAFFFCIYRRRR